MAPTLAQGPLAVRDFWLERTDALRDAESALADAYLAPDGPARSDRGASARVDLPDATVARLEEITGGSPELAWTVLAAATALVLSRFGAGPTVAVRLGAPFGTGLPVLLEVDTDLGFAQWLGRVREAVAEACDHAPAEGAGAHVPDSPLQIVVGDAGARQGIAIGLDAGSVVVSCDVRLGVDIEDLATGVVMAMRAGLSEPGRALADIGLLGKDSRHRILEDFNSEQPPAPGPAYRDLLLARARAHPDAVAVHDGSHSFTYGRLCRYATAIALELREAGVGPDMPVALSGTRDAWYLVMAVGILFSGGSYMPVDHTLPELRRQQLLSGVRVLVSAQDTAHDPSRTVLRTEELAERARSFTCTPEQVPELLGPPPAPSDLAYVIYTSGSTGLPKGACIEHGSFLALMAFRAADCALRPGAELPQTAPVSFDISVWQMFSALTAGAAVCVVGEETVRDPVALVELSVLHGFEYLELVPTMIALVLDHLDEQPAKARALRERLRGVISTGEVLGVELARRWTRSMPTVPLLNAYGPAECTDDVTQGAVDPAAGSHTSVGRPLPHARVYVLDRDLEPVPVGVVGEIHVGGVSVGRGYFGDARRTADAFLPDPHSPCPGARMYRTGDRGRWRNDGTLECLGRQDTQVKLRGRRVELSEIERTLETHPDVTAVAVEVARQGAAERLVAFVATPRRAEPDELAREVTGFAAERLPAYMVPSDVVCLGDLPLTRNGKVDRKALGALAHTERAPAAAGRHQGSPAPRTEAEKTLCALWEKALKVPVGIRDDFFLLGGDSIVSIRIVQEAVRQGIALRPKHFYTHRTVEELARLAKDEEAVHTAEPVGADAPLTPIQRWFFTQDFIDPDHWNQSYVLAGEEPLDPEVLERALRRLVERHDQLRVRFARVDGELRQVMSEVPQDLLWRAVDRPAEETADAAHASLSVSEGPLLRAALLDGHRLLLTAHHLVVDQVSWDVLLSELEILYRHGGAADGLGPCSGGYFAWARHLAQAGPPAAAAQPAVPQGPPPVPALATDPLVANVYGDRAHARFTLSPQETTRLVRRAARESESGVPAALLAGLGRALSHVHPSGTLLVEVERHGRAEADAVLDVTRTVGWFTVLDTVALPVAPDLSWADAAAAIDGARPGFGTAHAVSFNYLGRLDESEEDGLFTVVEDLGTRRSPRGHRPCELEVNAFVVDGALTVDVEYVPGRHDHGELDDLLTRWRGSLTEQTGSPSLDAPAVESLHPLTPTQYAFFARDLPDHHHWNHGVLFDVTSGDSRERIASVLHGLLRRHSALRARFVRTPRGLLQGPAEDADVPLTVHDLSGYAPEEAARRRGTIANGLHTALDLHRGPVVRAALFRTPGAAADQLLLVVHHAVVDLYSWNVLAEDLNRLLSGEAPAALEEPGASYYSWASRLAAHVRRAPESLGLTHWRTLAGAGRLSWSATDDRGTEASARAVWTELDHEETRRYVAHSRSTQQPLFACLLADFGAAGGRWLGAECGDLLIELGGHGREDLFADLELGRTVGWFTTSYPLLLPLPGDRGPAAHREAVARRLGDVPQRGLGFEALRHLHPDPATRAELAALPVPLVRYDFDGELEHLDTVGTEDTGQWKPAAAPRAHLLDINASITNSRLKVRWQFSDQALPEDRVRELAAFYMQALRENGK
ncbi:amino acid adenylation domain-containing protein [Streptomyces sp. NPDC014872]|uniref:amino acid adenylation domain-containing protein n=1 Tax=Streptomyces sp. NPDC014872 TaxID=3364926 RepID=UPI0036F86722